jgi:rubredoxin
MKWYVVVETQADGKDYVGINDDSYTGGNIISEHSSEGEADRACAQYAQEQGLPLFADYREGREVEKHFACPQCGNRDIDTLLMDDHDLAHCQKCGTVYDPLETGKPVR